MITMIHQIESIKLREGNYNKEPNRNSGIVKFNNQNEQFTRGVEQQIWIGGIKELLSLRTDQWKSWSMKKKWKKKEQRRMNRASETTGHY